MNNCFKLIGIVAIFVFGLVPLSRAEALSVTPVRFELSGNPGETIVENMLLMNEGDEVATFYPSFANFEAQGESGNPAFVEPKEDLGTWIRTDSSVSIPPKKSVSVPFTITIPQNAEPGGHFAVVFFGDSPENGDKTVAVGSKVGVLVLLSVKGDVKEAGGLVDFNLKDGKFFYNTLPVNFEYRFRNDGGDRIKPEGTITLRNTFYILADKINGNPVEGNILPNSTRKFTVEWVKNPRASDYIPPAGIFANFFDQVVYQWKNFAFGFYFAKLHLSYGILSIASNKYLYFFVFPWQLLLVLAVFLMIVYFGGGKLVGRYNNYIIEKANGKARARSNSSQSHDN